MSWDIVSDEEATASKASLDLIKSTSKIFTFLQLSGRKKRTPSHEDNELLWNKSQSKL